MHQVWPWQPAVDQSSHSLRLHPGLLAAPFQRMPPVPSEAFPKQLQARPVPRHGVVLVIAVEYTLEPLAKRRHRFAHPRPKLLLNCLQFRLYTFAYRPCPGALIEDWLSVPKHDNLLFRVAVREIGAWLLADSKGLASYLAVKPGLVPKSPEALPDPKRKLVELARKSRRKQIREDIVPRIGSTAKQGPGYSACLSEFVQSVWDVESAANSTASLRRTLDRLSVFRPVWTSVR